jgi:hypothetical protein
MVLVSFALATGKPNSNKPFKDLAKDVTFATLNNFHILSFFFCYQPLVINEYFCLK